MNKQALPIGVFDSGVGGLTVLRALKNHLPHESFVYLGDTARLPYGTKSQETVKQYALQMARVLVERQIKALVIACNTATTAALPHLQTILPDIPVIGVVGPGAEAVIAATENQRIMILATETTIASQAYQRFILEKLPKAKIQVRACSLLVALAEEGMTDNVITREALKHYLVDFNDQDTLLLGCTHFPIFKPVLQQLLPKHVQIVDSAEATAKKLRQMLTDINLLNSQAVEKSATQYLVTDLASRFQSVSPIFLGETIEGSRIEVIDGIVKPTTP